MILSHMEDLPSVTRDIIPGSCVVVGYTLNTFTRRNDDMKSLSFNVQWVMVLGTADWFVLLYVVSLFFSMYWSVSVTWPCTSYAFRSFIIYALVLCICWACRMLSLYDFTSMLMYYSFEIVLYICIWVKMLIIVTEKSGLTFPKVICRRYLHNI